MTIAEEHASHKLVPAQAQMCANIILHLEIFHAAHLTVLARNVEAMVAEAFVALDGTAQLLVTYAT
jgi:hypothetical protein